MLVFVGLTLWVIHRYRPVSPVREIGWQGAFIYKVALGFANYYIWMQVIGHGDSLRYVHDSLVVYNSLFDDPRYYLQLLFRTSLEDVPAQLVPYQKALYIEWHVPEYNMVRLLAVLNLFTAGNPWGNIVLLAAGVFAAQCRLFSVINRHFSLDPGRQRLLFGVLFFLPSAVFWSSGLLKEGPVLALLCLFAAESILLISAGAHPWRNLLRMLVITAAVYGIRDYVAILLVVNGLGIWLLSFHPVSRKFPLLSHLILLLVMTGILIGLTQAPNAPDLFEHLRKEQTYFTVSGPDPDYPFQTLDGTPGDVFRKVPYAVNNILFRPNILNSRSAFRLYQSIELLLTWLALLCLLVRARKSQTFTLWSAALLLFLLELLFVFGLMVTDADTLSRYRSIPILGLLCLALLLPHRDPARK